MTHERDIERLLDHWFSDGPIEAPDRVIDAIVDRIDRQPQRSIWRLDWRHPAMTPTLKFGAAVAAVIVIAVIGFGILRGGTPNVGGPSPTPSESPSSSASTPIAAGSPFPCDEIDNACAGELTAGEHTSAVFRPALTFNVPPRWRNTLDKVRAYTIDTLDIPAPIFTVLSQVAIPDQNAACTAARKQGVGNTVADWVAFLTNHPGLDTSTPEPVTVSGHPGMRITFTVADSWTATCPDTLFPAVFTVTDSAPAPDRVNVVDDQRSTWTIVDLGGDTVIIRMESIDIPDVHAQMLDVVQPIIDSMQFAASN